MPASKAGQYNGWSFGEGTKFHVAGMSGFFDLPEVVTRDQPKVLTGGMFPGEDVNAGMTVTLGITIIADSISDYDTCLDALVAATAIRATELPLRVFGNTRYLYCRPRKRSVPIECENPIRTFKVPQDGIVIEFFATDPTLYTGTPP